MLTISNALCFVFYEKLMKTTTKTSEKNDFHSFIQLFGYIIFIILFYYVIFCSGIKYFQWCAKLHMKTAAFFRLDSDIAFGVNFYFVSLHTEILMKAHFWIQIQSCVARSSWLHVILNEVLFLLPWIESTVYFLSVSLKRSRSLITASRGTDIPR